MKKIVFGITGLTLGGAERVLVDTANALVDKYDVTIFTIYAKGEFEKELDKKIKLKTLYNEKYNDIQGLKKKIIPLKILFMQKSIYKKYIKDNYDVEIAFLEGPITRLFSTKNKATKKIAWIHNDITKVFGTGLKAKFKKMIDKIIYSKYDELVFVSEDNKKQFESMYKLKVKKDVAYNYINSEKIKEKSELKLNNKEEKELETLFENDKINFITVARLVEQKGIDRLIKVHKDLINDGYDHNMYVIGDGPEREKLEQLIKKNKIEKTFKLLGQKSNPYPYVKKADAFCLLSYYEGYGMVIEEAKVLNSYILLTNTAAREAVKNYKDKSLIVANSEMSMYDGFAKYITELGKLKLVEEEVNRVINGQDEIKQYDNKEYLEKIIKIIG